MGKAIHTASGCGNWDDHLMKTTPERIVFGQEENGSALSDASAMPEMQSHPTKLETRASVTGTHTQKVLCLTTSQGQAKGGRTAGDAG